MKYEKVKKEVHYKSASYKQLVKNISISSGYNLYEVQDVLNHFIGHTQQMLAEGHRVKIYGIGVIDLHKMKVKKVLNNREISYTTCRLSLSTDKPMMRFLKENYLATDPCTKELALSDSQLSEDTGESEVARQQELF